VPLVREILILSANDVDLSDTHRCGLACLLNHLVMIELVRPILLVAGAAEGAKLTLDSADVTVIYVSVVVEEDLVTMDSSAGHVCKAANGE
jgi:hypothetical protein